MKPQRYRTLADYFEQTETKQAPLARRLHISKTYMSMLVAGDRQPSIALALKIELETGVTMPVLKSMREAVAS